MYTLQTLPSCRYHIILHTCRNVALGYSTATHHVHALIRTGTPLRIWHYWPTDRLLNKINCTFAVELPI